MQVVSEADVDEILAALSEELLESIHYPWAHVTAIREGEAFLIDLRLHVFRVRDLVNHGLLEYLGAVPVGDKRRHPEAAMYRLTALGKRVCEAYEELQPVLRALEG